MKRYLSFLALVAVFFPVVFYYFYSSLYQRYLQAIVWPLGISRLDFPTFPNHSTKRILIVGDSRAKDWGSSSTPSFSVINCSIPGSTTGQLKLLLPYLLEKKTPDMVVIQSGINDLKLLGFRPDLVYSLQELCFNNLTEIVSLCRQHNIPVIVTLIIPPDNPSFFRSVVWSDLIPYSVQEINGRLSSFYSSESQVTVLDLLKELRITNNLILKSNSYVDTLHLNPEVNQMLLDILSKRF